MEDFFTGSLFNCINMFKVPLIILWVVLLIAATASFSAFVKIAKENPEGLPADHPVQRAKKIQETYFMLENPERVNVIWGLDDKEPAIEWSTTTEVKAVRYATISKAVTKKGQQQLLNLCEAPDVEPSRRCQDKSCLVMGQTGPCRMTTIVEPTTRFTYRVPVEPLCQSGRYCIIEQVKDFTTSQASRNATPSAFPVDNLAQVLGSAEFKLYMSMYFNACCCWSSLGCNQLSNWRTWVWCGSGGWLREVHVGYIQCHI